MCGICVYVWAPQSSTLRHVQHEHMPERMLTCPERMLGPQSSTLRCVRVAACRLCLPPVPAACACRLRLPPVPAPLCTGPTRPRPQAGVALLMVRRMMHV